MPDIEVIRRVSLARHLSSLATDYLGHANDLYLFSAANLMQDAVEIFLLAMCDHVNASISLKDTFDKYFIAVNEVITPQELPFKAQLLRLNRVRVASKHDGIQPDRGELTRLFVSAGEFFKEVSISVLGESFSTLSTIDLLNDSKSKQCILIAKAALESRDYATCAIECKKAMYLEFESQYSIYDFREGAKPSALGGLFGGWSRAPYYARNAEYIKEKVKTPFDYVCVDHADLDRELSGLGVDQTSYWNLWRLLPAVFKDTDDNWFVEEDFSKLDSDVLADNIQYIFDTAVEILLSVYSTKSRVKSQIYQRYSLDLVKEETPVYEKADRTSNVIGTTPKGLSTVECNSRVPGLIDPGPYWSISHISEGVFLFGFIHNDDLVAPEVEETSDTQGAIKFFDNNKGFGFIKGDDGEDVFAHISSFTSVPPGKIKLGHRVSYEVKQAAKGPKAINIRILK